MFQAKGIDQQLAAESEFAVNFLLEETRARLEEFKKLLSLPVEAMNDDAYCILCYILCMAQYMNNIVLLLDNSLTAGLVPIARAAVECYSIIVELIQAYAADSSEFLKVRNELFESDLNQHYRIDRAMDKIDPSLLAPNTVQADKRDCVSLMKVIIELCKPGSICETSSDDEIRSIAKKAKPRKISEHVSRALSAHPEPMIRGQSETIYPMLCQSAHSNLTDVFGRIHDGHQALHVEEICTDNVGFAFRIAYSCFEESLRAFDAEVLQKLQTR